MTRFGYGQSSTVTCAAEIKGQRTDHFQSHVDHNSAHGFVVVVGVDSARALFTNGRRRLQGQVYKVVASAPGRACQVCHPLTYATDALLVAEYPRNPRHIATFYLWDASVNSYCPQVWETRELWHHRMLYASVRDAILLEKNLMSICPQWSKARKFVHPKLYCCVVYCCAILSAYTAFLPSWHLDLY